MLRGIPISLLKFLRVLELFFKVLYIKFVVVVLPLLPVIAITFPLKALIMFSEIFLRDEIAVSYTHLRAHET